MNTHNPIGLTEEEVSKINKLVVNGDYNIFIQDINNSNLTVNQTVNQYIEREKKTVFDLYAEGIAFLKSENPNLLEAEACFDKAIIKNEKYVNAYIARGYLRTIKQQFESAIWDFHTALEFHPDHCVALYSLAISYLGNKQMEKALFYLEKAKELGCNKKNSDIDPLIALILKMEVK